ncbi:MAG TPA: hypothetical protein VKW08_19335 [Xanthobacteraceae bacterium]|nr:hypothetical protein [Xanthobacteraceae bacterium]
MVENLTLLKIAATDALESPELEPSYGDDMGLDLHDAHLPAADKALHATATALRPRVG